MPIKSSLLLREFDPIQVRAIEEPKHGRGGLHDFLKTSSRVLRASRSELGRCGFLRPWAWVVVVNLKELC